MEKQCQKMELEHANRKEAHMRSAEKWESKMQVEKRQKLRMDEK
jgi:hypothetical protein